MPILGNIFLTEELALEAETCFTIVRLLSLHVGPQEEASIKSWGKQKY